MKKIFNILIIIFLGINLYGQNFTLDGTYLFQEESLLSLISIKDSEVIIKYKNPPVTKPDENISFVVKHYFGMPFIELEDNMPSEVAAWWDYEKNPDIKTSNKILFLAFQGKNKRMFAFTEGYRQDKTPLTSTRYDEWGSTYKDCSSFLTEKLKSYPVQNLRKLVVDTPWVEGAKGDGIGEGFTIEGNKFMEPPGPYLLIMNGYISYDKPYLYKQNNRVKKIKVTGVKTGESKTLDILDTPHPQTVDISFITVPEDIRIEIADVYKGTKYDDTCLHYCICFDEPVIPYENSIGD